MIFEIERAVARITSVTPIMEKHGKKKKRPAHSIIFEMTMPNTVLDSMDNNGLREAFYRKPLKQSTNPKTGQTNIDTSSVEDGLSQLKFSWWTQWIEMPGELTGWVLTLMTGNTERSHIVLEEAKISGFMVLPKDLAVTLVKCKAIVHPTAHEKGKIDELLQTDVPISIREPGSMDQSDWVGHTPDGDDEDDDDQDGAEKPAASQDAAPSSTEPVAASAPKEGEVAWPFPKDRTSTSEPPREDPFAGSDLARGAAKSDVKVETKRSRTRKADTEKVQ